MRDEAAGPSRPADRGALPAVRSSHHGGDQTSSSAFATDPTRNVVLEASAGTGKTSVLVGRYLRLVRAGVDPSNILAITFTRKAAAEMRERIIGELRSDAARSEADRRRWAQLRDRLAEVSISTIDAFCLSLLREFPLEADLEPDFRVIDSTEVRRLVDFALDQALRAAGRLARTEPRVAMVMSQLPPSQLRRGLDHLLSRRMVAPAALDAFLARGAPPPAPEAACDRAVRRILAILDGGPGGLEGFLGDGPVGHPRFAMLADDLRRLGGAPRSDPGQMRSVIDRTREHFLTRTGEPRTRLIPYRKSHCRSPEAWRRHLERIKTSAAPIANSVDALDRDLNRSLVGGVRRIYGLVEAEYRRALDAHAALDFTDLLLRALDLLRQMDEFAQSRYRLESRYHHVLLDEFQDTSRAQWQLVSLLIQSWGEGFGLVHDAPLAPTVFVVGDRKQSIYRFRDAEVAVLREAADYIAALRPDGAVRESISRNFRAVGALLRFVNDVCAAMPTGVGRDAFRYEAADYFPEPEDEPTGPAAETGEGPTRDEPLGLVASTTVEACARATASEIARLLDRRTVRDRQDGTVRKLRPGDIAILFRSRESHVAYEEALQAAGIPVYVYKGLGFFDAPEVKDVCALVEFLADPGSDLRAAAFLRSRIVRLSDTGLQALAPRIAQAVRQPEDRVYARLGAEDRRVLTRTTAAVAEWLRLVDRITPAELVDHVLDESAYAFELRGHRRRQATENLKKLRGLIRRIQNRGYATMARIAEHIDHLAVGEEPNAVVEAFDAVNLMTVHAAKGLEFPVVFIVNLARGTGATVQPVRVVPDRGDGSPSVAVGPFVPQTDVDEHAREREESKRLFYVAATRAREALYLSTTVAGARLRPGRGSLAEVLPASLLAALERAAAGNVSAVDWVGSAGREHRFRVCHAGPPGASDAPTRSAEEPFGDRARDDFRRLTVVDPLSLHDADEGDGPLERPIADALLLDLLEDAAAHRSLDAQPLASRAQTLLRRRLGVGQDDQALVRRVVAAYQDVMRQPPLTALLGGACLFRVPFSAWRTPADGSPGLVRGTIACVARRARGVTVLDFRLVDPDPSHELRLEIQRQAASVLCAADADARLVYL